LFVETLRPLLERTYAAFNARDVDAVLAVMHPDVDWPNGLEGGRVFGHRAFRATDDGRVDVEVHQVVRDLAGRVLKAQTVHHVYAFADGRIASMEIRPC
jgi:ketosteroid isomerase-like protein